MSIEMNHGTDAPVRLALNGATMGTRWSAIGYVPAGFDAEALREDLAEVVGRVDQQMSTWKPDSNLMQLNAMPVGVWLPIPAELAYVLANGLGVSRASGGRFDMRVLHDVQRWGFGPQGASPAGDRPDAADGIEMDPIGRRARRTHEVAIDLSGIAKGFGVDLMARTMEAHEIDNYLVSIDGELQAGGAQADGRPWRVGVEAPLVGRREVATVVELSDCSLATSGDYRHGRDHDGRWISHTIDPMTGAPIDNRLASVTVQAPDCITADAWATALMVAGEIEGPKLAEQMGLDALFLVRLDKGYATRGVGSFAAPRVRPMERAALAL